MWHHLHSLLRHNWRYLWFWNLFLPVHPYFYPSTMVCTRPNGGWTGLCIKLCMSQILLGNTNNCIKPVREISSQLFEWCLLVVSVDPQSWNIAHVRHWIQWAVKEFGLEDVNIDDFKLTGKQLCQLKHDEFVQYIPKDQGDIFWTHLELLRKCKFVGEYPVGHMCLEIQSFCSVPAGLTHFFPLLYNCK